MSRAREGALLEVDLFLSLDALSRRLLAQLRVASAGSRHDGDEILLDCFLLAAGLNQILEDHLQRDFFSLMSASRHLPAPLATVARLMGRAGCRLRACRKVQRRLAALQRELAALVARLAESVAHRVLEERRGSVAALDPAAARELLCAAESVLGPLDRSQARLRGSVQRLPNCFRSFDQQPADCLRLVERFAERWPDRGRLLLVVGLRSSGNYLAPLCASFFAAAGYQDVGVITIRPGGLLGQREAAAIAAVAEAGGVGLLVDDPPRTGTQLIQAAAELRRRGLADTVMLLPVVGDADSVPDALRGQRSVVLPSSEWAIREQLGTQAVEEALEGMLVGRGFESEGGRRVVVSSVRVESIAALPPRRGHAGARILARLRDDDAGRELTLPVYAEGVGLGYFGRHALAAALSVSDHVPAIYGVRRGLLFRAWLPEELRITPAHLRRDGDAVAAAIAGYVATRSRQLPLDQDVALRLVGREAAWEHVGHMFGQAFGRAAQFVRPLTYGAAKRLLHVELPAITDACTAPSEWFGDSAHRLRKISFEQRGSSNAGFQSCDPIFDLAETAAAAEAAGEVSFGQVLRRHYESLTGGAIDDERWLLYRLLHHLASYRSTLREAAREPGRGEAAFARALALERTMADVYRSYFERRYFWNLAPALDGPLCAVDIDGVLETRWTAFPAIAPAGAVALRSLNVHDYRALLVSGRSLDEIRARCAAYRLPGGVAEYGSVVYDHARRRERSLLSPGDRDALDALRGAVERLDGVYLDAAYRHSVRAHTLDGNGMRRGLSAAAIANALAGAGVRGRIRAVPGDLQTDFVAAGVDKGRGLLALAEALGTATDHRPLVALAVGDSASDLPMLALAARAFAPANAASNLRGRVPVLHSAYGAGLLRAVRRELGHSGRSCVTCRPPNPPSRESRMLLAALAALNGGKPGKLIQALALARTLAQERPLAGLQTRGRALGSRESRK